MNVNRTLDVLKSAILLEKRGRAFYRNVAAQIENLAVRAFFDDMAEEEEKHITVLSEQFRAVAHGQGFKAADVSEDASGTTPDPVLSAEIKKKIAAADFEAGAISAAMAMEERAVKFYSERASNASDPNEKSVYTWLADWERGHLRRLEALERELTETVWHDNQFWPF